LKEKLKEIIDWEITLKNDKNRFLIYFPLKKESIEEIETLRKQCPAGVAYVTKLLGALKVTMEPVDKEDLRNLFSFLMEQKKKPQQLQLTDVETKGKDL